MQRQNTHTDLVRGAGALNIIQKHLRRTKGRKGALVLSRPNEPFELSRLYDPPCYCLRIRWDKVMNKMRVL